MNATPNSRRSFFNGAPSFIVIRGRVHWNQGGMEGILDAGQILTYKKHGSFSVEYAGMAYAIIHHVTLRGEVQKVFIPSQKRLWLSNGHYELAGVNYQSFLACVAEGQVETEYDRWLALNT